MHAAGHRDRHRLARCRRPAAALRPSTRACQPGNIGSATVNVAAVLRAHAQSPRARSAADDRDLARPRQTHPRQNAPVAQDPAVRPGVHLLEVEPEARRHLGRAETELRVQEQVLHVPEVERRAAGSQPPRLDDLVLGRRPFDTPHGLELAPPRRRRERVVAPHVVEAGRRVALSGGRNVWSGSTRNGSRSDASLSQQRRREGEVARRGMSVHAMRGPQQLGRDDRHGRRTRQRARRIAPRRASAPRIASSPAAPR